MHQSLALDKKKHQSNLLKVDFSQSNFNNNSANNSRKNSFEDPSQFQIFNNMSSRQIVRKMTEDNNNQSKSSNSPDKRGLILLK